MEGLERPPYPGAKGLEIFNSVSKEAWALWLKHQTLLINEKRLNLMDTKTRLYLAEQLEKFLSNNDYERPEGYVPPNSSQ